LGRLFEVAFDGGIRGGTVFHCIAEGKAGEGGITRWKGLGYQQRHGGVGQER
jgi:hypothetical protein